MYNCSKESFNIATTPQSAQRKSASKTTQTFLLFLLLYVWDIGKGGEGRVAGGGDRLRVDQFFIVTSKPVPWQDLVLLSRNG